MNHRYAACLSLIAGLSMLAAGEAAAVLGHDEAAAWRLLNQLRSDPRSSTFAITAHIQAGNAGFGTYSPRVGNFDWAHATGRMAATRPLPLDAQLNAIARALLANPQDPPERKPIDVTALLPGAGRQAGDAVLALQSPPSPTLPIAFARAMLRINGIRTTTSRDSATFDAARVLDPAWTEAGVACRASPAGIAVAFVLGAGAGGRAVSGVVYQDEDRDGACSPGEGMAGAEVRIGGLRTTTSAGGIWMLRLPAAGPATVAFATRDGSAQRPLAEDAAIADWGVPLQADCTQADRLLAGVTAAGGEQARMRARVQLLLGTRSARIDDDRRARVAAATTDVADRYAETVRQAMADLTQKPADYRRRLAELARSWDGALPTSWPSAFEAACVMGQRVAEALAAPPERREAAVAAVAKALDRLLRDSDEPALRAQLATWADSLRAARPAAAPAAKDSRR